LIKRGNTDPLVNEGLLVTGSKFSGVKELTTVVGF